MEMEKTAFVIRLPKIHLKALFTPRFFLACLLAIFVSFLGYWTIAIRPFVWMEAQVEAFSSTFGSDTGGRIVEINGQEGDTIRKGQVLFALDHELISAKQKQLKAKMTSLNEQIQIEKLRMEKAMQNYLSVSNEMDFAIDPSETIQKNLAILEEAQLKSETASAQLSELELEAAVLEAQLKKTTVVAPFEGVILKKWKNIGESLFSGESVYTVFDPKQTWIATYIPEIYLGKISVGMPVKVRLAAYPKQEWIGKIEKMSPTICEKNLSASKQSIRVYVSIEPNDLFLRPGLSAQVAVKVR